MKAPFIGEERSWDGGLNERFPPSGVLGAPIFRNRVCTGRLHRPVHGSARHGAFYRLSDKGCRRHFQMRRAAGARGARSHRIEGLQHAVRAQRGRSSPEAVRKGVARAFWRRGVFAFRGGPFLRVRFGGGLAGASRGALRRFQEHIRDADASRARGRVRVRPGRRYRKRCNRPREDRVRFGPQDLAIACRVVQRRDARRGTLADLRARTCRPGHR